MVLDVQANMKSKFILFTFLMHVPGFIMSTSLVHVVLERKIYFLIFNWNVLFQLA